MDLNKFTEKSQTALTEAQAIGTRRQHQAVDVEHLALALLEQEEGLVPRLLEKAGVSPDLVKEKLREALDRIPRVSGDTMTGQGLYVTQRLMDAGNMLKPMLARGELHCIGATTLDEYRKYIEKDAALERRFQPVTVDQPTVEDTISILRGLKDRYELHHGVRIKDAALVSAAVLSDRYISDRFLPDKAIDLVDEASAKLRVEIDSVPAELDEIQRRIMQLEIEREALKKEKDPASRERLGKLEKELADLKADSAG